MSETVMIVEDDAKSIQLLQLILVTEGYDVQIARDGRRALTMIEEQPPDLILLDLMLPGMDGFELLQQMRSDARLADVPVVVVSAKAQRLDELKADALGVRGYLTKPFRKAALMELVEANLPSTE